MHRIYGTLAATAILGLGLGLSACSSDKVAGGGPSGTEAGNAITAQILTADAKPAGLARVKIIESESIDGTKDAYTAEADENGNVTIEGISKGNYVLEASLDGKAVQVNVDIDGTEALKIDSLRLGNTAKVSGKVDDGSNGIVKVRGMDHSAAVVNGLFDMDSLPAGPLSLVFVPAEKGDTTSSYLKADEGSKEKTSTFASENVYLLLDDFQDSNYQNRFMPAHVYDGGWWYYSINSNGTPLYRTESGQPTLVNEDGNIYIRAGSADGRIGWPTVGVELGKSDKRLCNDISSVDSIAFKFRGTGRITFALIDETMEGDNLRMVVEKDYAIPADWTRLSVPLQENVAKGSSLTCVNQIVWKLVPEASDTLIDLQLDDIQLIGGDRLSIWDRK